VRHWPHAAVVAAGLVVSGGRATVDNLQEHLPRLVKVDPGPLDRVREELNRQVELLNSPCQSDMLAHQGMPQ
jgi:hypothetical protein